MHCLHRGGHRWGSVLLQNVISLLYLHNLVDVGLPGLHLVSVVPVENHNALGSPCKLDLLDI